MPKFLTEIVVKLPDRSEHRHLLEPGEYLVGRDPDCHIRVDCPDVSQRHARLLLGVDDLRLEDLGSSNGSFVQGERLSRRSSVAQPVVSLGMGQRQARAGATTKPGIE